MEIEKRVNGKTKLIGVIGNPIEHTMSPQLQNTIFSAIGENCIYVPFHIEKDDLEDAVKGFKALNAVGFNITVPFKKDIMKYLDEISDKAVIIDAVNTVKISNGRLTGYNTDAEGFSRAFKSESNLDFKDKKVILIGAGGAACSVAVQLVMEGAKSVGIINRTVSKAESIASKINKNFGFKIECYKPDDSRASEAFKQADIIVNATSVGMYPETENMPISTVYSFSEGQIVFDLVYKPQKTMFLKKAGDAGCKIINGTGMLFHQAVLQMKSGRAKD